MKGELRKNGMIGLVEYVDDNNVRLCVHMTEWWDGEGVTIELNGANNEKQIISLCSTQVCAVVALLKSFDMYDDKEVKETALNIKAAEKNRRKQIKQIRRKRDVDFAHD